MEVTRREIAADASSLCGTTIPDDEYGQRVQMIVALDAIWGHGFADDQKGDADHGGHTFRVARWIVDTNSDGVRDLYEFPTEEQARESFADVLFE